MREAEEDGNGNKTNNSDNSILDEKPLRIFGHPLTITQQMWLGFVVPAGISTIIYIVNFALDIAVTYQLFREGYKLLAGATLLLIYAPSTFCLISTLVSPPKLESICDTIIWVIIQIFQCALFPIGIIYRFATRLFWSVAALTDKDPAREQALRIAAAGHQTDLFFFIDSFLHAAPQAIFQAYILLSPQIFTTVETAWTQAISIVASVITLSKTVALYQRYESQRVVGRQGLWAPQRNEVHARALVNITKLDPYFLMGFPKFYQEEKTDDTAAPEPIASEPEEEKEEQETSTTLDGTELSAIPQHSKDEDVPINIKIDESTLPTLHDTVNKTSSSQSQSNVEANEQDALLPSNTTETGLSSISKELSHYMEPVVDIEINVPIEDRCFWPRIITPPSTPTADPHMRPRLSVNTLIRSATIPIIHTSHIALPIKKPRIKGLNEDEPLGIFTIFNAWSSYLIARVLVIAAFIHFYLWPSIGLLFSHYAIMVAYLCFCNPCPNFWAPLLGLVYILCPIEIKVRYKYPRIFLISFFALVLLEDLSTVILWYCGAEWESWWYKYAFFFIIGCHGIAALNAGLYLLMFKPQAKYTD